MKPSYRLFVAVALFAVGAVCWSTLGSSSAQEKEKAAPAVQKWEYKVVTLPGGGGGNEPDQKVLNALGDEGWELAGAPHEVGRARVILKRPKK
ncbi:DUF4177 domain-containing protein [Gemmata sp. G18]|uniref:DUF4177 domain-containing protein n=1 Tax=Gemmata palustris TaxID=2822762 RepID=A0ABS5BL23_9BACT|nr:DUF4177 domain-containing protein [Gemmata palustris]MBP3954005.1 DUF4177 domain-containing protein [Gemmata palustris]